MYLNNKKISTDVETLRQNALEFCQRGTEFMLVYGDFEKAMECFCSAIKTDFSCAVAYLGRGYVRQFSQNPDIAKALKDYEKALEYSNTISDTLTYLDALKLKAFAQLSAGNHTMAGQNFKSLLMIGCTDDPEIYYGLGEAARATGDQAAAKKFFSKVLELDKYFIEKSNNIGHDLYIKAKRYREAIYYTTFAVNIILTLFPEEKQMIFACCSNLVNMYTDVGEHEKANEYKNIVMNMVSPSASLFYEKDESSRDGARINIVLDDTNIKPQECLSCGNRKLLNRDFAGAIVEYDKVLKTNPRNADSLGNRGIAKVMQGQDFEAAFADLDMALTIDPALKNLLLYRGIAKLYLGDFALAVNDIDEYIKIYPNNADAYYYRGKAKLLMYNYQEALEDLNITIEMAPHHAEAFYDRAVAKYKLNDRIGALNDMNKVSELEPEANKHLAPRALLKLELNDNDGAIEDLLVAAGAGDAEAAQILQELILKGIYKP